MAQKDETSFRDRQVQKRLRDHDTRISRVEKAILIAVGWGLAEMSSMNLLNTMLSFVL
jgi:hypothetical protein